MFFLLREDVVVLNIIELKMPSTSRMVVIARCTMIQFADCAQLIQPIKNPCRIKINETRINCITRRAIPRAWFPHRGTPLTKPSRRQRVDASPRRGVARLASNPPCGRVEAEIPSVDAPLVEMVPRWGEEPSSARIGDARAASDWQNFQTNSP